jgi:hypothetical protein
VPETNRIEPIRIPSTLLKPQQNAPNRFYENRKSACAGGSRRRTASAVKQAKTIAGKWVEALPKYAAAVGVPDLRTESPELQGLVKDG